MKVLKQYGLDVNGLLFMCDLQTQQNIIESLNQEDRENLY